jgi:hypothetical protein
MIIIYEEESNNCRSNPGNATLTCTDPCATNKDAGIYADDVIIVQDGSVVGNETSFGIAPELMSIYAFCNETTALWMLAQTPDALFTAYFSNVYCIVGY